MKRRSNFFVALALVAFLGAAFFALPEGAAGEGLSQPAERALPKATASLALKTGVDIALPGPTNRFDHRPARRLQQCWRPAALQQT
jgi:hypothetical protein